MGRQCGLAHANPTAMIASMQALGVDPDKLMRDERMGDIQDLVNWLGAFNDVHVNVREVVNVIRNSPFLPKIPVHGLVIDIERAHKSLKAVLAPLNYRNLDDLPDLKITNTTTEFLSKYIFDRLAEAARAGTLGRDGRELKAIKVTISESHIARTWYEAPL